MSIDGIPDDVIAAVRILAYPDGLVVEGTDNMNASDVVMMLVAGAISVRETEHQKRQKAKTNGGG